MIQYGFKQLAFEGIAGIGIAFGVIGCFSQTHIFCFVLLFLVNTYLSLFNLVYCCYIMN